MTKTERDALVKAQREADNRLKELELQRVKMDKEHIESIEKFKSEL